MLTELYCTVDDFCKLIAEELGKKYLLGSEKSNNHSKFKLSEIVTIAVYYHYSGYKNFKSYYQKHVQVYLKKDFPSIPSYSRMIELKQEAMWVFALFAKALSASCTGISIIDSTALEVCNNRRIWKNKVFKGLAQRGKTSVKWFFGFKLHVTINDRGEIISFFITPGNVADGSCTVLEKITEKLWGKLIADMGYIGKTQELYQRGIQIIHRLRSNMRNKLISLFDKFLLRQRGIVETVFELLKDDFDLEHSRHRSIPAFFTNIFSVIIAYAFRPKKPFVNLEKFVIAKQLC